MIFFRALLLAGLLAHGSCLANDVAVDSNRRLVNVRDHALRLADLRFGPAAAPAGRTLEITDRQLTGRLEIADNVRPSSLTVIARPFNRDTPAYRERKIERLMPSAPASTRGLRVDRLPSIQAEAYGLQTGRTYHVLVLFAQHLVEIGGAAAEEDERQVVRDFVQPLVTSLVEASDLREVRSLEESARAASERDNQFERLDLDKDAKAPLIFSGRGELTDERLLALAESWFTAEDNARFARILGVGFSANRISARSAPSGTESLDRRISAIPDPRRLTLRILVKRLAKSERAKFESPDPRLRDGLLNFSSFPVPTPPRESKSMPGFRGRYNRWPTFAHHVAYVDGYVMEIAINAAAENDPALTPDFVDAQMVRLLDQLGLQ